MKSSLASVSLALISSLVAACDTSDNAVEGAHPACAYGGVAEPCPPLETSEDACWRLVECGTIALDEEDENAFDWGECVDSLDRLIESRQRLVIACIAASSCDELRASNHCFQFGDQ